MVRPRAVREYSTRGKAADLAERGVHVREADYSRPQALGAALAGVDRLLLVSRSEPGQRVAHRTNVIEAAKTAAAFLDAIGYDAYDVGPLSEEWRYQRDTTAYAYSADRVLRASAAGGRRATHLAAGAGQALPRH